MRRPAMALVGLLLIAPLGVSVGDVPDAPTLPGGAPEGCHRNHVDSVNETVVDALSRVRAAQQQVRDVADALPGTLDQAIEDAQRAVEDAVEEAGQPQPRDHVGVPPEVHDLLTQAEQAVEDARRAAEQAAEQADDAATQAVEDALATAEQALVDALAALQDGLDNTDAAARDAVHHGLMHMPVIPWTNLNQGPGTCMDADTVDGYHAQDFLDLVEAETAARAGEDAALHARIDTLRLDVEELVEAEAAARAAGDAALADAIAQEVRERRAQVTALETRVQGLEGHVNDGRFQGVALDLAGTASVEGAVFTQGPAGQLSFLRRDLQGSPSRSGDWYAWFNDAGTAHLWTNQAGTRLAVDPDGDVGIGTTSPTAKLDVAGDARLASRGDVTLRLDADTDNFHEGDNPAIILSQDGGAVEGRLGYAASNDLELVNGYGSDLRLGAGNAVHAAIKPDGKVGIGTTNPGSKLTVAGTVESKSGGFRFPDGTVQSTAARHVGGVVRTSGDIEWGSGFTVTKFGTGAYRITVSAGLLERGYTVSLTPILTASPRIAVVGAMLSTSGNDFFDVYVTNLSGTRVDTDFSFVAAEVA